MTKALAASVSSDLIAAGYCVTTTTADGINWTVTASTWNGVTVTASTISSFATAHACAGAMSTAVFS